MGRAEVIEDIVPSGSRLKLKAVQESTNYTCMVEEDGIGKLTNSSLIYVFNGTTYYNYSHKFSSLIAL